MKQQLKKFSQKYKNIPAPIKASIWFTICNIAQRGISLLSTPIFTRILTTEQYGIYSVYQSWYQILFIFATLNLTYGVYNNGLTKYEDDRPTFTSSMQGLSTTITTMLFVIYIIARSFWENILGLSNLFIVAMFVEFLFQPAYLFWSSEQRYNYKYKATVITTAFIAVSSPLLGIISVLETDYKAEARVLSYVFVQVIIGLIFYLYNIFKGKKFYHREYWKFALIFNIPLIPHYLSMQVLGQADRIMISSMCGKDKAAIYSVAHTISMMMNIVTSAINNSFIPYTYKSLKNKEYNGIRNNSKILLLLVGAACIVAMAFGPEVIRIFASKEYYDAIWIIPPVASSVYFMFLYPLFSNVEFYFEKTKFVMVASCMGALANLILNFVFIRIYDYYAAGYTTLVCYMIFACAHYFCYKKIILKELPQIKFLYDMKFIIICSIGVLATMICMTLVYEHIIIRYFMVIIIMTVIVLKRNKLIIALKNLK